MAAKDAPIPGQQRGRAARKHSSIRIGAQATHEHPIGSVKKSFRLGLVLSGEESDPESHLVEKVDLDGDRDQPLDNVRTLIFVSRFIDHFGMAYTSHILDQVKTLGFQQATATSISLGIDDLLRA
ncbi:unnamed protein product [Dovyalis caffra]|uniref:DNA-directed RNA polymerase n=1 Tax=Dovyalis caffra TaxID=77055 RepID=A0AAV1R6M3_9ROSI|nr:unnamed protein product [Dovyalis caffra]